MSKNTTTTKKTELVETHNIAKSIDRLCGAPYDIGRWKRALYHAVSMCDGIDRDERAKIRTALDLP